MWTINETASELPGNEYSQKPPKPQNQWSLQINQPKIESKINLEFTN